jgi:hypothetical protein
VFESYDSFRGRSSALLEKAKAIMNEANKAVREASRNLAFEILGALGVKPQEMNLYFGEGAAGAAIEQRLTQFAGAILAQTESKDN